MLESAELLLERAHILIDCFNALRVQVFMLGLIQRDLAYVFPQFVKIALNAPETHKGLIESFIESRETVVGWTGSGIAPLFACHPSLLASGSMQMLIKPAQAFIDLSLMRVGLILAFIELLSQF
ncbi:hypothetical protein [Thiobaca trueperi]|uniref:hypothetical protein n=1 Tax=Thiobaca trueperi TaxID=127458 RepID=UPI0014045842|nr:hypothetical protein [Thiobaca trueperi]